MNHLKNSRREIFRNLFYPERILNSDMESWVDYYAKAGATSFCTDMKDQAYVCYDSKIAEKAPYLGKRDLAAELSAAVRKRGLSWTAYIAPNAMKYLNRNGGHADWELRDEHGAPLKGELFSCYCWNSPYRKLFLGILREIAEKYRPDGFFLDGIVIPYFYDICYCYCDNCRERYRAEHGVEIPGSDAVGTPEYLRFIETRRKWIAGVMKDIRETVDSVDDGIALVVNCIPFFYGWTPPVSPEMMKYADFPCAELDPGNYLKEDLFPGFSKTDNFFFKAASLRSLKPGSVCEFFSVFSPGHTMEEILLNIDLLSCVGARISFASKRSDIDAVYKRMAAEEPYLADISPDVEIAVHWSEKTHLEGFRSHVSIRNPEDTPKKDPFLRELCAFYKMGLAAHRQMEFVLDDELARGNIGKARVFVLPDSTHLPDGAADILRKFTEDGGTLIATMGSGSGTGGGSEADMPFPGSGLRLEGKIQCGKPWLMRWKGSELEFENPAPAPNAKYLCFQKGTLREWAGEDVAPIWNPLPEKMEDRQIQQLKSDPDSICFPMESVRVSASESWNVIAVLKYYSSDGLWKESPAILERDSGAGKMIYLAFRTDLSANVKYFWLKNIFAKIFELAAGRGDVSVHAPGCVKSMRFLNGKNERIVRLVNDLNAEESHQAGCLERIPVPVSVFISHVNKERVSVPVGGEGVSIAETPDGVSIVQKALRDRMLIHIK